MVAIKPYREKPPPPSLEIVCARCGKIFYKRGRGKGRTKYCDDCRVILYYESKNKYILKTRKAKCQEIL